MWEPIVGQGVLWQWCELRGWWCGGVGGTPALRQQGAAGGGGLAATTNTTRLVYNTEPSHRILTTDASTCHYSPTD